MEKKKQQTSFALRLSVINSHYNGSVGNKENPLLLLSQCSSYSSVGDGVKNESQRLVLEGSSSSLFKVKQEVVEAIRDKKAVVALESTIVSHGMPYPQNLSTARAVEAVVRQNGAVPATIAIINGLIHIGLEDSDLETLAKTGTKAQKTSRRDIATVIAQKRVGSTTVSATALLASKAGIRIFATGGLGGVHRGGEVSMDVSADLTELGRTPITVVCAGAKSLLDIGRTLEYLETQGVTVLGYKTEEFPAFFTRKSGFKGITKVEHLSEVAKMIQVNSQLNLNSGMILSVPIAPEHEAEAALVERAIQQAILECDSQKITGRDITPFLLGRVNELTGGESLKSNIELIKQNAKIASEIAVSLSQLEKQINK